MHAKAGDGGDVDVGMAPRGPRGDAEEAGRNAWMSWFWEENSDKYIGFGVKAWFKSWCAWVWFCDFPKWVRSVPRRPLNRRRHGWG